jgi:hypothetical protein
MPTDAAHLPMSAGIDRRTAVRAALAAAAAGVALGRLEAMSTPLPGSSGTQAFADAVASLAEQFDTAGPANVAMTAVQLDTGVTRLIKKGVLARTADVQATSGRLLVISSVAAEELGDYATAAADARASASVAAEVGDRETESRAWACLATAQRNAGRMRSALSTTRRAYEAGRHQPAGIRALLEEAIVAAKIGNRHLVFDAAMQAERAHKRLGESVWGVPGFGLGTLHPSRVTLFSGLALARAGLYSEAGPRLAEAAAMLAETGGIELSDVRLGQSLVAVGTGDLDGALRFATAAVDAEAVRPSALVASRIADLDKRTRDPRKAVGPFAPLVERTRGWGPIRAV